MKVTRKGFTLIELLVVIAIIAILAAILFPVFAKARAKARQITCISNEKQIGLAMMQYFQDYDEAAPLVRTGPTNNVGDWIFTTKEMTWKDLIYPYIKSGGRPYNNGLPYSDHGDGGAFFCPENSASWSSDKAWGLGPGGPGDETTRFPRAYAVNDDAGINELGPNSHFWPAPYDNPMGTGNLATLQTPANTIMVGETRIVFPDMHSYYTTYESTPGGSPAGGQADSVIQGHGAGFTNFIFFDGHAKSTRAVEAIKDDLWDCYGPSGRGTQAQQNDMNGASSVPEWNPGF